MELYKGKKICSGPCGENLHVTDFAWRVQNVSRRAVCKPCYNLLARTRYKPDKRKDRPKVIKPKVEKDLYNSLVSIRW